MEDLVANWLAGVKILLWRLEMSRSGQVRESRERCSLLRRVLPVAAAAAGPIEGETPGGEKPAGQSTPQWVDPPQQTLLSLVCCQINVL